MPASDANAVIGTWATTSALKVQCSYRCDPLSPGASAGWAQVQRLGNAQLINEAIIGTGFKDSFSMDKPQNDAQFAKLLS